MWEMILAGLKTLGALFGLGEKITAEVHDANQRTAGRNEVVAADLKEANDADRKAMQAAVDTTAVSTRDSLRDGSF